MTDFSFNFFLSHAKIILTRSKLGL